MKLVVIFGPPAVGKMTVGFELAKLTGLKLFHNHLTIELVLNFFDHGTPQFNLLVGEFRRRIFEEVAKSDLEGMIFTFVWAIDLEKEREYIESFCDIFRRENADIYFVELEADFEERLQRNESEFRLEQKPSKRNIESSKANLIHHEENYQLNTDGDFFYEKNYLKINNTNLPAEESARKIIEKFGFSDDNA
jgi:hypothetical protein